MRRRDLLLSLFAPQPDDFGDRLREHMTHLWRFAAEYWGCDPHSDAIGEGPCKPSRQGINRREFNRARETACRLFDLQEKTK